MTTIATLKSVSAAADHLLERGFGINEITNNMIRKELGSGSLSTITPLLRDWKTMQLERKGLDIEMPEEIKDKIMIFAAETWRIANGLSQVKVESKLQEVRDSLRDQEDLNAEFDAMADKLNIAEVNMSGIYVDLQAIKDELEGTKRELDIYYNTEDSSGYMNAAHGHLPKIKGLIELLMSDKFNTNVTFK